MIERIVIIDGVDPQTFYGVNNANINLIRNLFPKLRMAARGNVIKVIGEDSETAQFERKIKEIEAYAVKYNKISEDVIIDIIKGEPPKAVNSDSVIIFGQSGRPVAPRNANQAKMVRSFAENDLTFALGPAGTGKTYIAIALAVAALKNKACKRVILSRPAVEAGEKHQMKMFLTRMGMNAKMVITGDATQIDLPRSVQSGLLQALRILKGVKGIGVVEYGKKDIVRHPLVQRIVDAYEAREQKVDEEFEANLPAKEN